MPSIQTTREGDVVIVRFTHADLSSQRRAVEAGDELLRLVDEMEDSRFLIDFDDVEAIGSLMIGQLFSLQSKARGEHVTVKACGLTDPIRHVLEMVKLPDFIEIYEDREAALAACRSESDDDASRVTMKERSADAFREAAEAGDPAAQFDLAVCYDSGLGGPRDPEQAVRWYRRAAEQGHTEAQYVLGKSYAYGIHVEQNYGQALDWYRRAADQGHPEAQYAMGVSYEYGLATDEDEEAALDWYRLAARQNHAGAQQALDRISAT